MNLSAVMHPSTLPFRQPLARNLMHFRIFTAKDDCNSVTLYYWKRSEPFPESLNTVTLHIRYTDAYRTEWAGDAALAEEAHYIKYFFKIDFTNGEERYYCEYGFSREQPQQGCFEVLQANETDVLSVPEWAKGSVYYQIFPERFAAGSSIKPRDDYVAWNAAPTRENFFGGDLEGIKSKLPYLRQLGVECLYMTPVFAGDFNHKYATTDYFHVDPDFGTDDDLISLVEQAHHHGIRVILDGVFNHCGIHFAPFADVLANGKVSPYCDWFYCKEYPLKIDPKYYECVGDYPYMPRLRTANPKVREYILSVMLHWLQTAHIDGWRLDVADELDAATVRYLREKVKAAHPDALLLGETWSDASRMVCEGDQFDSAMNYLFRDAMVDFFAKDRINAQELHNRLSHMLMKYPDVTNLCMYNCLDSHDTARFLTEAGGEKRRLKLAIAFQMLFPGSPALFYGDEVGIAGENDPDCRRTMPWEQPDNDLLQWTREMISLRRHNTAVRLGEYHILQTSIPDVVAFERSYNGERIIAVFNRSVLPQTLDFADAVGTVTVLPQSVEIIQIP